MDLTIERLRDYACGWWQRNDWTEWPSVRQCARQLGVSQKVVIDLVNEDADSCLEYYNAVHKPGDEFVCIINHPLIDQRFPEYEGRMICDRAPVDQANQAGGQRMPEASSFAGSVKIARKKSSPSIARKF